MFSCMKQTKSKSPEVSVFDLRKCWANKTLGVEESQETRKGEHKDEVNHTQLLCVFIVRGQLDEPRVDRNRSLGVSR